MKKYLLIGALIGVTIFALWSCDRPAQPIAQIVQPAQTVAPQPVVMQQSNDSFWQNMMIWHLLTNNGPTVIHHYDSRPSYVAPRPPVVSNTTIINKTLVRASPSTPTPARSYSAPSYAPPRATSYSGSYSSRSSYSSYSSRSSYSGFSGRR
jgi:hypothetical protein